MEGRVNSTAKKLKNKGVVSSIEKSRKVRGGEFRPKEKKIRVHESVFDDEQTRKEQKRTLAHELGHAIDEETDNLLSGKFNKKFGFQLASVSEEMRGEVVNNEERQKYRRDKKEQFADFFSKALTKPKKAKKENTKAFKELNTELKNNFDLEI